MKHQDRQCPGGEDPTPEKQSAEEEFEETNLMEPEGGYHKP